MTKKTTKILTTTETLTLKNLLKNETRARFEIVESEDMITVNWKGKAIFKALAKGDGYWIVRHNSDLFVA